MATYFHGSHEVQPETMQTLYLMNPDFTGYSDAPPPVNMIFLNSATNSFNLLTLPQPQHLVGIPVQDPTRPSSSVYWTPTQQDLSLSLPVPEITSHATVIDQKVKVLGSQSSALVNSKYLRFAQQLLDEVVIVWKGIRDGSAKDVDPKKSNGDGDHVDESAKQRVELTTVERQELQMKKAKLVNMLDEVGRRYRQYHHKMQIIVSSFEAAAGISSAKAYTALALQTISKQFRCLRDAITSQIRATAKSLGEEEFTDEEGTKSKLSWVQFVDQQVRQQRALQQLGTIHHNAWRPQRGLPESSVSVLRAWLFEHFLHPYPKDSDKQMLAKQTGLTKSQVSNWFINARVRLWKPMVEEMYKEEMKDQEQGNADEKSSETDVKEDSSSKSKNSPSVSVPPFFTNVYSHTSYGEGDDDLFMQSKLKKARSEESMNKASHEHNDYSFITGLTSHGCGFGEYSVGEIERFGIEQFTPRLSSNGVSLTLGLTQYDNLSLSEAQPSYISNSGIENNGFRGLDNNQSAAHPSNAYENMSIESRKRFASQLPPDFVA